jgi:D-threonine aldolase
MSSTNWYRLQNEQAIDTPTMLVYPERVRENLRMLSTFVPDPARLRPHVKTHKMAEVVQMMFDAGIGQFKCATVAEAEMLGQAAAPDVLLAYQPIGPKIGRLLEVVRQYPATHFACLVDDPIAAKAIAEAYGAAQQCIDVYLDLNVGMNRTGIKPDERALALWQVCEALDGIRPVGLHAYDGHHRQPDLATRKASCDEAFEPVTNLKKQILAASPQAQVEIVAGGTPTFPIHAQRPDVVCSPGTFVFWDWGYGSILAEQPFLHAALLLSRVISVIDQHTICTDLGHKSVAAENPLDRRVHWLNAPEAQPVGQSEEHLVLRVPDAGEFAVGTVLYGVPYHVCPTIALHDRVWVVHNQKVEAHWQVCCRDRYLTI